MSRATYFAIAEQREMLDGNPVNNVDPPRADTRIAVLLTKEPAFG